VKRFGGAVKTDVSGDFFFVQKIIKFLRMSALRVETARLKLLQER
jgi:hypothetical protein